MICFGIQLFIIVFNDPVLQVCKPCFDQGPQTVGQSRSWMTFLKLHRGQGHTGVTATADGINISNFRKKYKLFCVCFKNMYMYCLIIYLCSFNSASEHNVMYLYVYVCLGHWLFRPIDYHCNKISVWIFIFMHLWAMTMIRVIMVK